MNLTLVRYEKSANGIFGKLLNGEDVVAETLEHAYQVESRFEPKMPEGFYTCVRGHHILHGMSHYFETFEIQGVPNHTGILFHVGNYNHDSDGCVLVGSSVSADGKMIIASMSAFARLMDLQKDDDHFYLTVQDHPVSTIAA